MSHSWWIEATEPLPIWCSQLFLGRPGGLLQPANQRTYLGVASKGIIKDISSWKAIVHRGPHVQTNPGSECWAVTERDAHKIDALDQGYKRQQLGLGPDLVGRRVC